MSCVGSLYLLLLDVLAGLAFLVCTPHCRSLGCVCFACVCFLVRAVNVLLDHPRLATGVLTSETAFSIPHSNQILY